MAPKLNENGIPSFDDLPLREGDPHHSAWGLYGDHDEKGTLNRLTNERVVAAAKNEIQKGIRYVPSELFRGDFLLTVSSAAAQGNPISKSRRTDELTNLLCVCVCEESH